MTIELPGPGEPRRPHGPRDSGDAWVVAGSGERYWGRFGAAGLLAHDPQRGVLLQHRASWSHFGDTWGLPGGARHAGESAREAALREAAEEAGVPPDAIRPQLCSVVALDIWSYTTLVGEVTTPFDPVIGDPESHELAWVPVAEVDNRALHPGFAAAWPGLRALMEIRPVVVVDAANVVGSVPDGWWRDRVAATERLMAAVAELTGTGVGAGALELPADLWFPQWVVVTEGAARAAVAPSGVVVVRAPAAGDDQIVAETTRLVQAGHVTTVVTSDRQLARRVGEAGAGVRHSSWLRGLMGPSRPTDRE